MGGGRDVCECVSMNLTTSDGLRITDGSRGITQDHGEIIPARDTKLTYLIVYST